MPKQLLTDRSLTSLKAPSRGRTDYYDTNVPGLHLRVSASGERIFSFRFKARGSRVSKRITLGTIEDLSLGDARDRARNLRGSVLHGRDPRAEEVDAASTRRIEEERARTDTFAALVERVLERFGNRLDGEATDSRSTRGEWERKLRVDINPVLGSMRPGEIKRADVRDLVLAKMKTAPYAALRVFEVVRWIFARAVEEEWVASSPCAGLKNSSFAQEKAREKTFTDAELRALFAWAARPDETHDEKGEELLRPRRNRLRHLIPMVGYTAVRCDEALSGEWSDFDFDRDLWSIPPDKTKSDRKHEVPLSPGALRTLKAIRATQKERPSRWVFPAYLGDGYMSEPKYVDELTTALGYGEKDRAAVLHDFRRTIADRLENQLGVASNVVDSILGHSPGRLRRTYRPSAPVTAVTAALTLWSHELDGILKASSKAKRSRPPHK
jgi:integrase